MITETIEIGDEFTREFSREIGADIDRQMLELMAYGVIIYHHITFLDKQFEYGQQRVNIDYKYDGITGEMIERHCNRGGDYLKKYEISNPPMKNANDDKTIVFKDVLCMEPDYWCRMDARKDPTNFNRDENIKNQILENMNNSGEEVFHEVNFWDNQR